MTRNPASCNLGAGMMRKFRAATLALTGALALCLAPSALAAKSTTNASGKQSIAPLGPTSDYLYVAPNRPSWCLAEDDQHQRTWSGSLNGTFVASDQLCNASVDYYNGTWWDSGGLGLQVAVYVVGALSDLSITSPLGDSHHGMLVGSSTSKNVTTYKYEACFVPPYSITSNTGGAPLPGGTWTVTLLGNITSASYEVDVEMADVTFQQNRCPPSERNLVS